MVDDSCSSLVFLIFKLASSSWFFFFLILVGLVLFVLNYSPLNVSLQRHICEFISGNSPFGSLR